MADDNDIDRFGTQTFHGVVEEVATRRVLAAVKGNGEVGERAGASGRDDHVVPGRIHPGDHTIGQVAGIGIAYQSRGANGIVDRESTRHVVVVGRWSASIAAELHVSVKVEGQLKGFNVVLIDQRSPHRTNRSGYDDRQEHTHHRQSDRSLRRDRISKPDRVLDETQGEFGESK